MEYNSGSNQASDFKFEITSTITPELYDTKSYYQLIVSITKCEKLFKSTVEKTRSKSKENISEQKSLNQLISSIFVFNLHLSICSRKKFSLILIG